MDIINTQMLAYFQDLDCVDIIERLARKFRKHRGLYDVVPITTAKVPIVKFKHRKTGLEGDISLYNTLVRITLIGIINTNNDLMSPLSIRDMLSNVLHEMGGRGGEVLSARNRVTAQSNN